MPSPQQIRNLKRGIYTYTRYQEQSTNLCVVLPHLLLTSWNIACHSLSPFYDLMRIPMTIYMIHLIHLVDYWQDVAHGILIIWCSCYLLYYLPFEKNRKRCYEIPKIGAIRATMALNKWGFQWLWLLLLLFIRWRASQVFFSSLGLQSAILMAHHPKKRRERTNWKFRSSPK
jgi:hypothetical protein